MNEGSISSGSLVAEVLEDYHHPVGAFVEDAGSNDYYAYLNAGTCPDCGASMLRLGGCYSCMSCGFASCGC